MARVLNLPDEGGRKNGDQLWRFITTPSHSIVGPGDSVEIPAYCARLDWEAEVGVVIGRRARNVSVDDAMAHVAGLTVRLWVNGRLMQDSSTCNMIFGMAEQVAHLSTRVTLLPGDVIATGTPAGVGMAHSLFLQPGDEVRIEVDQVGVLVTRIKQPST